MLYLSQSYELTIAHLFSATEEMLAGTLASIHNLHFIVNLVHQIRESILNDTFL